jgi:hypothetical protein
MRRGPANFVIFFDEKEGTTALMSLLDKLPGITILRMDRGDGRTSAEPFDLHSCGRMAKADLKFCLDGLLGSRPVDPEAIQTRYGRTAKGRLIGISAQGVTGLKMRFRVLTLPWYPDRLPRLHRVLSKVLPRFTRKLQDLSLRINLRDYKKLMTNMLKRSHPVVFLAVRQDVFRWALSKYHGDGTGKPGHLQFKLAKGELQRCDIGKIYVEPERFKAIVAGCEAIHERKRELMQQLLKAGLEVYPICYEDFLASEYETLARICRLIRLDVPEADLRRVVAEGADFQKVHSEDISEFVENHQQMIELFGDRFVPWQ